MSDIMAENVTLYFSCCKYCILLFCYYLSLYFNLLYIYQCINKGYHISE